MFERNKYLFSRYIYTDTSILRNRYIIYIFLIVLLFIAVETRLHLIIIRGGLHPDQFEWAMTHYLGGLTKRYIEIRDILFSSKREINIFLYLPGYPTFIYISGLLFNNELIYVRVVQSFLDSLAIFPLFFVSYKISKSAPLALISSGIYAAAPWWAAGSTYLLAESLLSALVISLLAALVAIRERPEKLHYWMALGLFAAVLPFFRSDMILLFIPLAIWAILVAPVRRRLLSAACVVIAFAAPLFAWIIRNYFVHGNFLLTPPIKWYAAWSGLGQIPNDYGYIVSDELAVNFLKSNGMEFGSPQADAYWKTEYISAWLEHPAHVLQTIFFRIKLILLDFDFKIIAHTDYLFLTIMYATPFALLWLLWRRRWTDALLVALPAGYALCSLGILYVEQRYVRYAGLTYVLAFPVLLAAVADFPSHFARSWGAGRGKQAKLVLGVLAIIGLIIHAAVQYTALRSMAVREVYAQRLDLGTMEPLPWIHTLDTIAFVKAMPHVRVSRTTSGLEVSGEATSGMYLLTAAIESGESEAVIVSYKIRLNEGGLGIGVLSRGNQEWLSYNYLIGEPGSVMEGEFTTIVEAGGSLAITAEQGKGHYSALVQDLRWKGACLSAAKPDPLQLIFNKDLIPMGPCP